MVVSSSIYLCEAPPPPPTHTSPSQSKVLDIILNSEEFTDDGVDVAIDIITMQSSDVPLNQTLGDILSLFAHFTNFTNDTVDYLDDDARTEVGWIPWSQSIIRK